MFLASRMPLSRYKLQVSFFFELYIKNKFCLFCFYFHFVLVDTKNLGGGLITADIKLNEQRVKFDLRKIDDTKYELRLVPSKVGTYQVYMFLNGDLVKGNRLKV